MTTSDSYKSIKYPATAVYKEKGSRFIAFAVPVQTIGEINSLLDDYRKKYHNARHYCYAYCLGSDRKTWRANDDGEPSGTAGKPILGQINSFGLTNIIIIVIRYFGGTLLGTSGLINAYRAAANDAIRNSEIIECTLKDYFIIEFPYSALNKVMKVIKEDNIGQSDHYFGLDSRIVISFRQSMKEKLFEKLSRIDGVKLSYLKTE